jgi:ABC-type molybdenum transport system ATPase subunit/photorepair protein PhrA
MRLLGLHTNGFLSLESFSWPDLDGSLQVIVGPNGSGKTNVLRAIQAAVDALSYEHRQEWETAATRGSTDPAFDIRIDFELDDLWEKGAVQTFLHAAFCDTSTERPGGGGHQFDRVFSDLLFRGHQLIDPSPLTRGTLYVRRYTTNQWGAWAEFPQSNGELWRLHFEPGSTLRRVPATVEGEASPITLIWRAVEERAKHAPEYDPLISPDNPIALDLARLLEQTNLRLEARNSGISLPTHQVLWRVLGVEARTMESIDARRLFYEIFRRQLMITTNVRDIAGEMPLADPTQASTPELLSNGSNLSNYLFLLKNGTPAEEKRFEAIRTQFTRLTGNEADVQLRIDANRGHMLTTYAGKPGTMTPLAFSGAGVAESLFIAAVMGSPGRVLLLDEPGANLQHGTQVRLLQALSDSPNQALVVTHSQLLVPADERMTTVGRLVMRRGTTVLVRPNADQLRSHLPKITQEWRASSDARAILFADAVVLVEGDSELGTFLEWNRRAAILNTTDSNIQFLSVDGDQEFPTYIFIAETYEIPWAVICDARAMADAGRRGLARQLTAIGVHHGIEESDDFPTRKRKFSDLGIHSLADSATDEIEHHVCVQAHLRAAGQALSSTSKPRRARWIAERHDCPHAVEILRSIAARFRLQQPGH